MRVHAPQKGRAHSSAAQGRPDMNPLMDPLSSQWRQQSDTLEFRTTRGFCRFGLPTMKRSMASSGFLIVSTASTTMSVSWSARSSYSFVLRDVRATQRSSSRSSGSAFSLNVSKKARVALFACSYPCAWSQGGSAPHGFAVHWTPTRRERKLCSGRIGCDDRAGPPHTQASGVLRKADQGKGLHLC